MDLCKQLIQEYYIDKWATKLWHGTLGCIRDEWVNLECTNVAAFLEGEEKFRNIYIRALGVSGEKDWFVFFYHSYF